MRVFTTSVFCLVCTLWSTQSYAEERPVVVELFTSQGCPSCPPLDDYFLKLAKKPNVIAIALHVDYWDYIGWKDSFADPAFTKRQRNYANAQKESLIYTPQLMVNGAEHAIGTRHEDLSDLIQKYAAKDVVMRLSTRRSGTSLVFTLSDSKKSRGYDIHLVSVSPNNKVEILSGENSGKTLRYANVVTQWRSLGVWNGQGTAIFHTNALSHRKNAILVQVKGHGEIVAASWVE